MTRQEDRARPRFFCLSGQRGPVFFVPSFFVLGHEREHHDLAVLPVLFHFAKLFGEAERTTVWGRL